MTLKKSEFIKKYCEEAWQKELEKAQEWKNTHRDEMNANRRKRCKETPEKIKANNQEANRKGGKYYNQKLKYMRTGIPGARNVIRSRHGKQYRPYKQIIAPESQIHHEWIPNTCEYRGVALVESRTSTVS